MPGRSTHEIAATSLLSGPVSLPLWILARPFAPGAISTLAAP